MAIFALLTVACRDNAAQQPENATELKEAVKLDSLSNDLESTTKTIEQQTKELQNALDEL